MKKPLQTRKEVLATPAPGDAGGAGAPPGGPASPLGDPLWRPTSMIRLRPPLNAARGALPDRGVIHTMRGEHCVVRPYRVPRDPRTARQLRRRATLGEISATWPTLPPETREAWQLFAGHSLADRISPGCKPGNLGQDAWTSAQVYRLGMGLGYGTEPPSAPPPASRITAIEPLPPLTPGSFRFRLTHDAPWPAGLFVLLQLTRPLESERRKARDNQFLWAADSDPDSFLPLGLPGAVYEIARPAVEVPEGKPYAVRARIVNTDGLPGEPATAYLVRG